MSRQQKIAEKKSIRVLVAEDQTLVREGLCLLLGQDPEILALGVPHGEDLLKALEDEDPDILVLDLGLPELYWRLILLGLRKKERPKVLMLASTADHTVIVRALHAGAKGYVLKSMPGSHFLKAVKAVATGEIWVERKMTQPLLDRLAEIPLSVSHLDGTHQLTRRELQIIKFLEDRLSNKEIAERLGISETTAKTHVRHILSKLHLQSRHELALQTNSLQR